MPHAPILQCTLLVCPLLFDSPSHFSLSSSPSSFILHLAEALKPPLRLPPPPPFQHGSPRSSRSSPFFSSITRFHSLNVKLRGASPLSDGRTDGRNEPWPSVAHARLMRIVRVEFIMQRALERARRGLARATIHPKLRIIIIIIIIICIFSRCERPSSHIHSLHTFFPCYISPFKSEK